jgi:hypothetical protein
MTAGQLSETRHLSENRQLTQHVRRGQDCTMSEQWIARTTNGDGLPCSKCGDPVDSSDRLCTVVLRGLPYGFHTACFDAWSAEDGRIREQLARQ